MTLRTPTIVATLRRPRLVVDQDPYDPGADQPEDVLGTDVGAIVWFPRGREVPASDQVEHHRARFLLNPVAGVVVEANDIIEDQGTGARYRVEWAMPRAGVTGLEHTGGQVTVVKHPA